MNCRQCFMLFCWFVNAKKYVRFGWYNFLLETTIPKLKKIHSLMTLKCGPPFHTCSGKFGVKSTHFCKHKTIVRNKTSSKSLIHLACCSDLSYSNPYFQYVTLM